MKRADLRINPCAGLRIAQAQPDTEEAFDEEEVKALRDKELSRLLLEIPASWQLFFEFLVHTGLRISEASELRWSDLDLERRWLRVRRRYYRGKVRKPKSRYSEVLSYLLAELARAPELWIQKGHLARVLIVDGEVRDEGIVPLEHFVDESGPNAVAVAVEMDSEATIYPAVYVRAGGKLSEHALSPHPTHAFDSDVHARELAAFLESLGLR